MNLTIHRGTHNIGGSCVELSAGNNRIIIDTGIPLLDDKGQGINLNINKLSKEELFKKGIAIKNIPGLYRWDENQEPPDAILISHSHIDHYGLLSFINSLIPLYMSSGCKALIEATLYFRGQKLPFVTNQIENKKPFTIGAFTVTPFLVDHSGFDAYAFLVEADGKKVFYSGDFRAHGKKGGLFKKMIQNPPKDIDCMILEGTRVAEQDGSFKTEDELRDKLTENLKNSNQLIFFACASQNIDRLSSLYSACRRSKKTLVIDPYTAYILDVLKDISPSIPQFNWRDIRIFFTPDSNTTRLRQDKILFKYKKAKITSEEIEKKRDSLVIKTSFGIRQALAKKGLIQGSRLIYSMWQGYYKEEKPFWDEFGIIPEYIHTSGHASSKDLRAFANAVNAKKITPIHTLYPEEYEKLFKNVLILEDGERMDI